MVRRIFAFHDGYFSIVRRCVSGGHGSCVGFRVGDMRESPVRDTLSRWDRFSVEHMRQASRRGTLPAFALEEKKYPRASRSKGRRVNGSGHAKGSARLEGASIIRCFPALSNPISNNRPRNPLGECDATCRLTSASLSFCGFPTSPLTMSGIGAQSSLKVDLGPLVNHCRTAPSER